MGGVTVVTSLGGGSVISNIPGQVGENASNSAPAGSGGRAFGPLGGLGGAGGDDIDPQGQDGMDFGGGGGGNKSFLSSQSEGGADIIVIRENYTGSSVCTPVTRTILIPGRTFSYPKYFNEVV